MTKFLLLGVAAAIATPALAAAPQPIEFTQDGERFVAQVQDDAQGRRHIDGHDVSTGADFSLIVVGDKVSGIYNGTDVAFVHSQIAETASR